MSIAWIQQAVATYAVKATIVMLAPMLSVTVDATELVLRDNIGEGSSATDGLPGGESFRVGANFDTPGVVIPATPVAGTLKQARFVIFARRGSTNGPPVDIDELEFMQFVEYVFHVWTQGVEGDGDTFDENPIGNSVNGHIKLEVNKDGQGPASVTLLGETGGRNESFGTFLVSIDLTPFNIKVPANQELVMSLVSENPSAVLRISQSRLKPDGVTEDVYQFDGTRANEKPGFLSTNYRLPIPHYNGFLSMEVTSQAAPLSQLEISRGVESAVLLSWASLVGFQYTIEAGTALRPDEWTPFATELPGTGEKMELEVPIEPDSDRYFRLSRQSLE